MDESKSHDDDGDETSTPKFPFSANGVLNKEDREFVVTPIFQYSDNKNTNSSSNSSNSSNNRDSLSKLDRNDNSNTNINSNAYSYKRKIIDRIVTSIPYNAHNIHSKNNDNGEIEVCIEEYYQKKSFSSHNHAHAHNHNHTTLLSTSNRLPLLRRVAVRSYTGMTGTGMTQEGADDGHVDVNIDADVGVLHASFSLPVTQLPRNIISEMLKEQSQTTSVSASSRSTGTLSKSKNWLCWTTFQNSHNNYNSNGNGNEKNKDSKRSRNSNSNGKSLLCVLTGPSTLKIFDVYPKGRSSSSNNDHVNGVSEGEGHTIALPFEASSIFALPSPYCGLLIQRADNGDNEDYNHPHMMQFDEEYYSYPSTDENINMNTAQMEHQGNNEESNNDDDDDNDEGMKMNIRQSLSLNKDDFIIEGPPSTVRLGINSNLQPRASNRTKDGRNGGTTSPSPSSASTDSDSDLGLLPPPPPALPSSSLMGSSQMVPSLYTLHHPLDDILPCVNSPYSKNKDQQTQQQQMGQQPLWRNSNSNSPIHHFANVFEQVVFVGKPRSFIPIEIDVEKDDNGNSNSNNNNKDAITIVVTFNTKKKRHAFWILNHATPPSPKLPLWQQTSRALDNTLKNLGPLSHLREWMVENNGSDHDNDGNDDIIMEDSKMNDEFDDSDNIHQTFSPLSEIHARVSLSCMYVTTNDTVSERKNCNLDNTVDSNEMVANEVFLATTEKGDGDFVLCLLQGIVENSSSTTDVQVTSSFMEQNDHVLRCFTLQPVTRSNANGFDGSKKQWKICDINDIKCLAAQPIYSTPINPPSFSPFEESNGSQNFLTEWRKTIALEPPIAVDIFICRYSAQKTKLSVYRGSIHIADCNIPPPPESLGDVKNSSTTALYLQHAVGDRVDVGYCYTNERSSFTFMRMAVSLFMKNSPITENSLLAIGSSILYQDSFQDLKSEETKLSSSLSDLCYAFRSDCAILSQLASALPESQEIVDDIEWCVFSSLLSAFFSFALNKASTCELLSSLEVDTILKEDISIDADEAWEDLLQSEFHSKYFDINNQTMLLNDAMSDKSQTKNHSTLNETLLRLFMGSSCLEWLSNVSDTNKTPIAACLKMFDSLHLLYEEMKLSNAPGYDMYARLMGNLLHHLSSRSIKLDRDNNSAGFMDDFVDVYKLDLGNKIPVLQPGLVAVNFAKRVTTFRRPPCFLSLLERVIQGEEMHLIANEWKENCTRDKVIINGVCSTMGTIIHFFNIYYDKKWDSYGKHSLMERDRHLVMGMIEEGFTTPSQFLEKFPLSIASQLMEVCHRCRSEPPSISNSWSASAYNLVGRTDLARIQNLLTSPRDDIRLTTNRSSNAYDSASVTQSMANEDKEKDGLVCIEKFSAMLFPNDNRVREAARLLRSSRPTFLRVQRSVEASDHDYERQKQEKLSLLCRRIVSLPLGRGMMTYGTLDPLPAEQLSIPILCLAGRIPPRNVTLALDGAQMTPEMKEWPEFHNGVAAGLRLPIFTESLGKNIGEIARTWIVYNKPSQSSSEYNQNNGNQAQSPPPPNHAHGGFLMALGLRGQLKALSMTDIYNYLTKGSVTMAVGILLGMAANERGSCDLSVSKMLCIHVPSLLPASFSSIDVASPSQTAAVAGIGLLYQGSSHRLMTEFLLNEIGKRPTNEQNISDRESYTLCCGISLGMVNLGLRGNVNEVNSEMNDGLSDLRIEERLLRYIVGGVDEGHLYQKNDRMYTNGGNIIHESERCSRIYEGDMINTDVTAPGATLALGMIYLQSGNKSVASQLALPDTNFSLDNIRPDFLFLSVVARSLVLWHEVEASTNWIEQQIPMFIQKFYSQFRKKIGKETISEEDRIEVDTKAMKEAHAFITAGACFSIGLRFAGTGNKQARDAVFEKVVEFQRFRDESDHLSILLRPQRQVVEMCLGSTAISLAMIMAGTGDLKTLRLLKILRWRCDEGAKHGSHMSFGAAIGVLFLGGGTCTFGREKEDIAALLMAFFPRFPMSTQDNQYHLQALRHMYSLAVKQRRIEAIDIDSNEKTFVPIKIEFADCSAIEAKTPCLLMNRGKLSKIRVTSDRYYPVEIDFKALSFSSKNFHLFVKKKSGRISHVEDPYGLKSNSLLHHASHGEKILDLLYFTDEARDLQVYARYLCNVTNKSKSQRQKIPLSSDMSSFGTFCGEVLCESLVEEKTDSVPLQLALYDAMVSIERKPFPTKIIWDLRLLRSFYENKKRNASEGSFEIVSPHFVAILCQHIDQLFSELGFHEQTVSLLSNFDEDSRWFGPFSIWHCKSVHR